MSETHGRTGFAPWPRQLDDRNDGSLLKDESSGSVDTKGARRIRSAHEEVHFYAVELEIKSEQDTALWVVPGK